MSTRKTVLMTAIGVVILAATSLAAEDVWREGVNGWFHDDANWTDGSTPTAADSVLFSFSGPHRVDWGPATGDRTTQSLNVTAGDVTLAIESGVHTWSIVPGASPGDVVIDGESSLTLGMSTDTGTLIVDTRQVRVGPGTLNVLCGNQVRDVLGYVGFGGPRVGSTVSGVGSTWSHSDSLEVHGRLTISDGGNVTSAHGEVSGFFPDPEGAVVTVTGAGSTWTNTGGLLVGGDPEWHTEAGRLVIREGGEVSVGETLYLAKDGVLDIFGGTLRFHDDTEPLVKSSAAVIHYGAGTIAFDGDVAIGTGEVWSDLFGAPTPVIGAGKVLEIEGRAAIAAPLTIQFGTLRAGSLSAATVSNLTFVSGTLQLNDSDLVVGYDGLIGPSLTVNSAQTYRVDRQAQVASEGVLTINSSGTFRSETLLNEGEIELAGSTARLGGGSVTNRGLLRGEGRVDAVLDNAGGEVRVGAGQRLVFTSRAGHANGGTFLVNGGELEFFGPFHNVDVGEVNAIGDTAITFLGGLANDGALNFAGGNNRVSGAMDIAETGRVSLGNSAETLFLGNVLQNGTIGVGAGSRASFYGDVTGAGHYTGEGTCEFYGELSPGSSPAIVTFSGSVMLDGAAELVMELGETESDMLDVGDVLTLHGTLDVRLLDDFRPNAGDRFDILDWGGLVGRFDELLLPELDGPLAWRVGDLYTTGEMSVEACVPGDANKDWKVDDRDASILGSHWRQPSGATWTDGDFNGDEAVNDADAAMLAANWGYDDSVGTVPEPATVVLLLSLCLMPLARRRR